MVANLASKVIQWNGFHNKTILLDVEFHNAKHSLGIYNSFSKPSSYVV